MIHGAENIAAIFNIFHDGTIAAADLAGVTLRLRVEIEYLAERIDPAYRNFEVTLRDVAGLGFTPWTDEECAPLHDPDQIFTPELEILSCERDGERLEIACSRHSAFGPGGLLAFAASAASVVDEGGREHSLDELIELATAYWEALKAESSKQRSNRPDEERKPD